LFAATETLGQNEYKGQREGADTFMKSV